MSGILAIKLGALGDVVMALGPLAAIRRHHAGAPVTILTTRPYAAFLAASPYADAVWIDRRPAGWDLPGWLALRRRLRGGGFERVYDLQTSDRSSAYFRLLAPGRPEWSGIARGCSHPHANPRRDFMHTLERQAEQLAMAGVAAVPPPDLGWVTADIAHLGLAPPFGLLVPGGSAHRPAKRWPAARFGALARRLAAHGMRPVVIGGAGERGLAAEIRATAPDTLDLTGRTDLLEIAALGRRAALAVGNDTGPMHLLAVAGTPSTVLFSAESDPALTAPRGPAVTVLRCATLGDLVEGEVAATLRLV